MKYLILLMILYVPDLIGQIGIPNQYPILKGVQYKNSIKENEYIDVLSFKTPKKLEKRKGKLMSEVVWNDSCLRETIYFYGSSKIEKIINRYYNSDAEIIKYEVHQNRSGSYSYFFYYDEGKLISLERKLQDFTVEKREYKYLDGKLVDINSVFYVSENVKSLFTNNLHFIYDESNLKYITDIKSDTLSSFRYEKGLCVDRIEKAEGNSFVKFVYSYDKGHLSKEVKYFKTENSYTKMQETDYLENVEMIKYFDENGTFFMEVKKEEIQKGKFLTTKKGVEGKVEIIIEEKHFIKE